MILSKITASFEESVIREMTRVSKKYPGSINLAQGFPDFPAPQEIKQAAIKAINNDINQYAITWGRANLREAIAKKVANYNNMNFVDPDKNITVCCGATEAMISSLMAIINPRDEVVIFEPFYENYGPDCKLSGATPKYVKLSNPNWSFDEEELKERFNSKTKAVIINTPNNPTGKVFTKEELKIIADLCIDYNAIAVTDEIYEHIIYDNTQHISIASISGMENNSITVNSISKTYSLTGWRVGWTIANEEIIKEIKKVHDFLTVGAAAPLQEAAVTALSLDDKYYLHLKEFYTKSRDRLFDVLKKTEIEPIKPKGAYYIMTDCTKLMEKHKLKSAMDLATFLLKKINIATVPGTAFYSDKKNGELQTRFCFCKKDETLTKAIENLERLNDL